MKIENWEEEFMEQGAELEHDRWARWQAYLFSKSEWTKDGYLIPKELCFKWQKQIDTPYSELSEQEKESDRKETRNYLPLLEKALTQQRQEIVKEVIKFVESESGKSGRKEIVEYLKQKLTK